MSKYLILGNLLLCTVNLWAQSDIRKDSTLLTIYELSPKKYTKVGLIERGGFRFYVDLYEFIRNGGMGFSKTLQQEIAQRDTFFLHDYYPLQSFHYYLEQKLISNQVYITEATGEPLPRIKYEVIYEWKKEASQVYMLACFVYKTMDERPILGNNCLRKSKVKSGP